MALSTLQFTSTNSLIWTASETITGLPGGIQSSQNPTLPMTLGTANANNAVGGSDELYFAVLSISASGTSTLNLQSFTDILSQATISLSRLKFINFKLLGSSEFAPNGSTAGTACSSVTVGNAGSNPNLLFMNSTTPTFVLNGGAYGEEIIWRSPTASGLAVTSGAKNVLITNNDGTNAAKVMITFVGGTT